MYINQAIITPKFRAAASESDVPEESAFFHILRNGGNIDLDKVNEKSGNTMFQSIVNENYTKLIAYMLARGIDLSSVINKPNAKGEFPLDTAKTPEMKILLKRVGGIKSQDAKKSEPVTNPVKAEDAKTIAAREYMTQSVQEKVEQKMPENEQKKISYFDSFEEVDDEKTEAVVPVKQAEENAEEKAIKKLPKEINTDGIKDFKRLQVTADDILSLDDLIGQESVKSELKTNIITPLQQQDKLKENKINLPNGILITGEGGGEITVIKALANEAEIPVVMIENPSELSQMLTAVESRYKKTGLRTAILAQGFDKWWSQGQNYNDPHANNFRNNIKGITKKGGLFIATTNDKSALCNDFIKSGIIDKVIEITKPNEEDRKAFFKRRFEGNGVFSEIANDESISKLAMLTDNLSFSDMTRILDESARTAIASEKNVDMEIFEDQLKDFSLETDRVPITEENRTAAYDTPNFKRVPIEKGEMVSLDELGGMPETKQRLRELYVEPMKNIDELTKIFGADAIPDGAIFYGAPGNGKTLTAKVLARELGLPYYETRLSDFGTALVHESGKAFKKLADQLDRKFKETGERSVWFLDEFDSVGTSRNGNGYADKELTDALLQEFTNPAERGFILIAATNNLDDVDSALKRRGRLGNWIEFKNPDQVEREDTIKKILKKHDFTKDFSEDKDLVSGVAKELDGFSMSSIANILKDAKRDFYLNKTDFKDAVKKALDINLKREMGELCGKTQLSEHVYSDYDFKTLDELGGMTDVIKQLREQVMIPWDPEIRKELLANGIRPTGGFILEGPPGGGKTTVIETLAREMNVPLYKMELNQKDNMYVGGVESNIKQIFDQLALVAKVRKGPVMLFFDEAERFFPRMSESTHENKKSDEFKNIMNNAAEKGIILAGATNHINLVNHEVTGNPRRMGTVIHCGNPNFEDRKNVLSKLLSGHPIITDKFTPEEIEDIALSTDGFSIGQLSDAVKKILTQAIYKKEKLTPESIVNEFKMNIVPQNFDIKS